MEGKIEYIIKLTHMSGGSINCTANLWKEALQIGIAGGTRAQPLAQIEGRGGRGVRSTRPKLPS